MNILSSNYRCWPRHCYLDNTRSCGFIEACVALLRNYKKCYKLICKNRRQEYLLEYKYPCTWQVEDVLTNNNWRLSGSCIIKNFQQFHKLQSKIHLNKYGVQLKCLKNITQKIFLNNNSLHIIKNESKNANFCCASRPIFFADGNIVST